MIDNNIQIIFTFIMETKMKMKKAKRKMIQNNFYSVNEKNRLNSKRSIPTMNNKYPL